VLAGCFLDSQSPVILILSGLHETGQKLLISFYMQVGGGCPQGTFGNTPRPHPLTLATISKDFEAGFFTRWMPFLSPNQQCQSTKGTNNSNNI